jgi:SHR-binding domain of vacuolar-sorting associated protein 13
MLAPTNMCSEVQQYAMHTLHRCCAAYTFYTHDLHLKLGALPMILQHLLTAIAAQTVCTACTHTHCLLHTLLHVITQVTVVPRFCVVNLLRDAPLSLRQKGAMSDSPLIIPPGERAPWHWPDQRSEKTVEICGPGTSWSFGSVDIARVGSTALLLPAGKRSASSSASGGSAGVSSRVVHVDVKLASSPATDEYAVLVVLWSASRSRPPMYRVRNRCSRAVRVHQVRHIHIHTDTKIAVDYVTVIERNTWCVLEHVKLSNYVFA